MFDGVCLIREIPGFELNDPLVALLTPLNEHRRFAPGDSSAWLASLFVASLDGEGASPGEALDDLGRKIAECYDNDPELKRQLQIYIRRTDETRQPARGLLQPHREEHRREGGLPAPDDAGGQE